MRLAIAVLAALLITTGAVAQNRGFYGPFTGYEAEALSDVWPEIREARSWQDINWRALGLNRAPGDSEAQRLMASNWDEVRREPRFEDIDWDELVDDGVFRSSRTGQTDRFERQFPGPFSDVGPFTRDEAAVLSQVWPEIREAAEFDHIDWRAYGLARAPGNSDARRIMAANWDEVRQEARFENIDWDDVVDQRDLRSTQRYARGSAGGFSANPFTREEEATMSRVWGEIREAGNFNDIDWRAVGLSGPPGSREARRILAQHWGQIRAAARFEDVDWDAITGQRRSR
jgi:hypothetical protein